MSQEHTCNRPLWTSTLDLAEGSRRMWSSPMKGGCWEDMVVALSIKKHRAVSEERRGWTRFFRGPKTVWVDTERPIRLSKFGLVTIATLRDWLQFEYIALNTEDRFVVSAVERGVLHVEWTEDPSEWSAKEILELPKDLLVGLDPQASPNPQTTTLDERDRQPYRNRRELPWT